MPILTTGAGKYAAAAVAAGVKFDVSGFSAAVADNVTVTPINVGSGANGTANRALVVGVSPATGSPSQPNTVKWNGVNMTYLGHDHVVNGTIWAMVAPATGANNLVAQFDAGGTCFISALSVVGADQTGGTTTFHNFTFSSGSTADSTVTVPSVSGEIVFGTFLSSAPSTVFTTPDGSATNIGKATAAGFPGAAAWITATGTSTTLGYAMDSSTFNVTQGVAIKAA